MSMKSKYPVVGVIGSSSPGPVGLSMAYEVGRLIAEAGAVLVTGGLGGVMDSASKGCSDAGGLVLGILPDADPSTANPYVDIAIPSGMGHARNVLVAQTAQVLIAVEGALGTLSEIAIGLKTGRPVFLLGSTLKVDGAVAVASPQQAVSAALMALEEGTDG
jgi:hypothetical protein